MNLIDLRQARIERLCEMRKALRQRQGLTMRGVSLESGVAESALSTFMSGGPLGAAKTELLESALIRLGLIAEEPNGKGTRGGRK